MSKAPTPNDELPIAPAHSEEHRVAPPNPEEPVMPDEQTTTPDPYSGVAEALAPNPSEEGAEESYAPIGDEWAQESEELPPRPRRRLLGEGGNPIFLALLGVLLLACGFIGGVLVEKGQTSSTAGPGSSASGLAARFATLRGAGSSTTGSGASSGAPSGFTGGGFAGRFSGLGGAAGGLTTGEVSYISGSTLYVTNSEGNTVKVTTSPASSITKTVKADLHGIHPGETVVVRGAKGSDGAISAESISVGAGGGGLASLFGEGGGRGSAAAGGSGGGGVALFGG